jgi:hypothetical protein
MWYLGLTFSPKGCLIGLEARTNSNKPGNDENCPPSNDLGLMDVLRRALAGLYRRERSKQLKERGPSKGPNSGSSVNEEE